MSTPRLLAQAKLAHVDDQPGQDESARLLRNARQLKYGARRRLGQTMTAVERRALYLLEAGKNEQYAKEFPQ